MTEADRFRVSIWMARCAVAAAIVSANPFLSSAQPGAPNGEWPTYGGDLYSSKYAPLDRINKDNVGELEVVWRWVTADARLSVTTPSGEWFASSREIFNELQRRDPNRWRGGLPPRLGSLKATPLMVGGVLYLNTPLYQAAAIDAATGETIWVHNPKSYEAGTPTMTLQWNARGVARWSDGAEARI